MARRGRRRRSIRKRARSVGRKIKHKAKSGVNSQWGKISSAISAVAFLAQLTSKERERGVYANKSKGEQVKILVDNVLGNTLGVSIFGNKFEQQTNIDGMFNKYSASGAAMWLYGHVPFSMPHKAKAKTLGKKLIFAGAAGGFFDSEPNQPGNPSQVGTINRTSSVVNRPQGSIVVSSQ